MTEQELQKATHDKYIEIVRQNDQNAPEIVGLPDHFNLNIRTITHQQPGATPQEIAQKLYDIDMSSIIEEQ